MVLTTGRPRGRGSGCFADGFRSYILS